MAQTPSTPSPKSPPELFIIKDTPGAGRGAFATQFVPRGTPLLLADDLIVHVLLREYRGEVCWECFAYDRGKKLSVRVAVHGFTFCSEECEAKLRERYDSVCLEAWAAVEKASKPKKTRYDDEASTGDGDDSKPTASAVNEAWSVAEGTAASILSARTGGSEAVTKSSRRAIQQASSCAPPADVVSYQMHAVLARHTSPGSWASVLALADETRPYLSHRELQDHIASYLFLLAILPKQLLALVTPDTLRTIRSREVQNSFGIRSLGDEGSEFFGYGVWPSASYFNHSCRPNVRRRRVGRTWVFEAAGDVGEGQELYISYLNGEEEVLNATERRARLSRTWGFECGCQRCSES